MHLVLAAKVWHYWISIPLVAAGILMVVATIIGYLKKVVAPQYPKRPRSN